MNSRFTKIVRLLLGFILLLFGLNKFFRFIPEPAFPEAAASFFKTLGETGYFIPILAVFEIFIGVLLLSKKWVPFALILLAPISLNILLFHLFLDPGAIAGAIVVSTLNIILIYKYWKAYTPLFN